MVTLILLLIIALLSGFIVWLLQKFFEIPPKENKPATEPMPKVKVEVITEHKGVVGTATFQPLKAPPQKPHKRLSDEDIEEAFENLEFETEYAPEPQYGEPSEKEKQEVIKIDYKKSRAENEALQRAICVDYEQISNAARKIIRKEPISIEDAEVLIKMEGTSIDDQIYKKMPHYMYIVQTAITSKQLDI